MAEESDLEKTEPASSRRLEQAREEGQVPRSREIGAFLVLMVAAASFWFVGPWMMQRAANIVRRGLTLDESVVRDTAKMTARFSELAFDALLAFSPLIGEDIFGVLTVEGSLASRNHIGGTAPAQVRAAIERARARLSGD